ncbi:MAG: hypothetical protein WCT31_02240 [Candidatus Micrarchaeia archaeon]|jgi:hypothetical protein
MGLTFGKTAAAVILITSVAFATGASKYKALQEDIVRGRQKDAMALMGQIDCFRGTTSVQLKQGSVRIDARDKTEAGKWKRDEMPMDGKTSIDGFVLTGKELPDKKIVLTITDVKTGTISGTLTSHIRCNP